MKFRTLLQLPTFPFSITHQDRVISLGSCFAENMAALLQQHKFEVLANPFGVLYHPVAIAGVLERSLEATPLEEHDLVFHNGCWHSFQHHSRLSHPSKTVLLERIQQAQIQTKTALEKAGLLLLTFGTSIVYEHRESGRLVANCHKIPKQAFVKYRLSAEQITTALHATLTTIQRLHPNLNVLLTVSPVRHIKEGIIENQRSKAALLLAVEALQTQLPNLYYFPAYELVLDDLRDYRFFKKDLVHPNEMAVDYVWEQFSTAFFEPPTQELMKKITAIRRAVEHRPFHPEATAHQQFLQNTLAKITQLEMEHPQLNFSVEKLALHQQLGA